MKRFPDFFKNSILFIITDPPFAFSFGRRWRRQGFPRRELESVGGSRKPTDEARAHSISWRLREGTEGFPENEERVFGGSGGIRGIPEKTPIKQRTGVTRPYIYDILIPNSNAKNAIFSLSSMRTEPERLRGCHCSWSRLSAA